MDLKTFFTSRSILILFLRKLSILSIYPVIWRKITTHSYFSRHTQWHIEIFLPSAVITLRIYSGPVFHAHCSVSSERIAEVWYLQILLQKGQNQQPFLAVLNSLCNCHLLCFKADVPYLRIWIGCVGKGLSRKQNLTCTTPNKQLEQGCQQLWLTITSVNCYIS